MTAGAGGAAAAPDPTDGGRDPRRVPENWRELIDPGEWALNDEGLPARRAARVIALREDPAPAVLLAVGHDFADAGRSWAFTPEAASGRARARCRGRCASWPRRPASA